MQKYLLDVNKVENALNHALTQYENSLEPDTQEFFLLKVQILIFYYEMATGIVSVEHCNSKGFAQAVALKSLLHSIYEYNIQMNRTLLPRILRYAKKRKILIDTSQIKAERAKWKAEFSKLKAWKPLRNAVTGHYDSNIEYQINLLKTINRLEIYSAASAFANYSLFVMTLLPHQKISRSSFAKT